MTTTPTPEPVCPGCGMPHPMDAIFCSGCGKAVAELRYVREEFSQSLHRHEKIADTVTRFVGRPPYFVAHIVWFALWILVNSGLVAMIHRFDNPPFNLLALLLAIEAVFMTGFLLISQNREAAYESKRAELDYEINVRNYRQLQIIAERLERIEERLRTLEERETNAR